MIDMAKLRVDRQSRLREALRAHDVAACLLITPHSLRYASGLRNCAIYQTHIPATYFFLPAEGASVLFDSQPGRFTGQELETIDEISGDLIPLTAMWASERGDEWAEVWAAQMAALMARDGGDNRRLAIERLSPRAARALEAQGLEVLDAEDIIVISFCQSSNSSLRSFRVLVVNDFVVRIFNGFAGFLSIAAAPGRL